MGKSKNYTELKKGDLITLSDPQTEIMTGGPADFEVQERRVYTHDLFTIYGYVLQGEDDEEILFFMVKTVDDQTDLRIYYLDHEGTQKELIEEGWEHWSEDGECFSPEIAVELPVDEKMETFDKVVFKQKSFGPFYETILKRYTSKGKDSEEFMASICEYETDRKVGDIEEAFIEWSGENNGGWVEVYYGTKLHDSHVEVYPVS